MTLFFRKADSVMKKPTKTDVRASYDTIFGVLQMYGRRKEELGIIMLDNYNTNKEFYQDCKEKKVLLEAYKMVMGKDFTDNARIIVKLLTGLNAEDKIRLENDLKTYHSFN